MKTKIPNTFSALILPALLLMASTESRAEGYAGYAGAFLRMGSGPVAMASGDAGVARGTGAEQASYNPAGLPYSPANEVWIAWHNLSLDRTLGHFSALYQVPSVAFWGGAVRPIILMPPSTPGGLPYAVYPNETRSRGVRSYRPEDYLPAVAAAALDVIDNPSGSAPAAVLNLPEGPAETGSLKPLVLEAVTIAREEHLATSEEIIARLRSRYQKVQKKPAAVAITWTHAGTEDIQVRDFDGIQTGTLGFYENRFSLAFGIKLHSTFSIGVSAGVLYALVPDMIEDGTSLTSTTFIADAGVQWRPFLEKQMPMNLQSLAFGAAAYGLGGKNSWNTTGYWSEGTTKEDNYPDRYRIGLAYSPFSSLALFTDVETDLADLAQFKGGFELAVMEAAGLTNTTGSGSVPRVLLRAGYDKNQPTFGLGLEFVLNGLGMTRLDYAYVLENASPVATQVVSWRFLLTR